MRTPQVWFALSLVPLLFAVSPQRAGAQTLAKQLEQFRKPVAEPGEARSRIVEFREGTVALTKSPADQAVFAAMGQYLVNRVTHHEYYATSPEPADLKPRPADKTVSELLNEMRKYLLVPPADGKINLAQEEYIREFGAALDKSFAAILSVEKGKTPPPLIRVNAGRMLAVACESGAPAHWPMVIALLKNPETPPELLYYALKAAEGLLGGFDIGRFSRLAPGAEAADGVLYDLVHTLEEMVVKGPPILDKLHVESGSAALTTDPKAKPGSNLAPEQVTAIQMYRVAAIRALGRLRSEILGGKVKPNLEVRPVYTLARVAVGDPSISPAFSKKEIAEAVIGLARINPTTGSLNIEEWTYAIAYGSQTVFTAKATNPEDNSIAWKGYAGRMNAALQDWQAATLKNTRVQKPQQKSAIETLVKKANDGLFNPVLNPGTGAGAGAVKVELIETWREDWRRDHKPGDDRQLFTDVKGFKLPYGPNQ